MIYGWIDEGKYLACKKRLESEVQENMGISSS